jgi:hypothetical protein
MVAALYLNTNILIEVKIAITPQIPLFIGFSLPLLSRK